MDELTDIHDLRRRRYQFSLRSLLLATVCLGALIAASVALWREYADPLRHIRHFHRDVSQADRIVVRGAKPDDNGSLEEQPILFEVTDKAKLAEVREHLQFLAQAPMSPCFCGGHPEIDWYRGDERLVQAAIKHNESLEWPEVCGSAVLAPESSQWIVRWLTESGVPLPVMENQADAKERVRQELRSLMPAGFWDAIVKAEAQTAEQLRGGDPSALEPLESLKDRYVGQLCKDRPLLYRALFQMLGVLCASWEQMDFPEQIEAFEFLTRAPRDELEGAFASAAESQDRTERRGAARMVFAQHFMPLYGKTEDDLARWVGLLAAEAYCDPYPENRRLVLNRLVEYPRVRAGNVLTQAVEDPDAQVRRWAIEGLRRRGGKDAVALLRRVAVGQTKPRKARILEELPSDGQAAQEGQDADTDAKAAANALQAMVR